MRIDYDRLEFIEKEWKKRFADFDKIFDFGKNIGWKHLDFGCGFGAFLKILADKYPKKEFYGVDFDKNELIIGKKIYKNKNLFLKSFKGVYGKEKFDSISFFFVLHEIEDVEKLLRQIREMLKKNAKVFVYDFRLVSKEKFRKFYDNNKDPNKGDFEEEYEEHNRWITEEFEDMMQGLGFNTLDIKSEGDYYLSYVGEKKW